jgi:shikimate kinase
MSGPRRIVLVGLPGAGKSTVGALVAERLGWRFVDLDREIERAAGRPVTEIFAEEGEGRFRELERDATRRLAGEAGVVLAPGGGWALDRSNVAALGEGSLVVYLSVSPAVALERLGAEPDTRPLLAGPEPLRRLEELAAAREAAYLQSDHTLRVDSLGVAEVADTIVALAMGTPSN